MAKRDISYRPVISFMFDKVYSIQGIHFLWDTLRGGYPYEVFVQGYDVNHQKQYEVLLDITSSEGFYPEAAMENIRYVDITIYNWSVSNNRAKIMEISFGPNVHFTSYNNGRIVKAEQNNTVYPDSNSLPVSTLSLEFNNYDLFFDPMLKKGISAAIAQRQIAKYNWRFMTSAGVIENGPEQIALLESFNVPGDSSNVKINLTSRLALLTNTFLKEEYTGESRTLYALAEKVLENSNIQTTYDGEKPWMLSNRLKSINSTAPIPALACNQVLQLIALAGGVWLYTDLETGWVKMQEPDENPNVYCEITDKQALEQPEITIQNKLKKIDVELYSYNIASEKVEIHNSKMTLTGVQTVTLKYNQSFAVETDIEVTGALLNTAKLYTSYAIVTVTASENASVTFIIEGRPVTSTQSTITTYYDPLIDFGEEISIDNSLITSTTMARLVSEFTQKYYSTREKYKLDYLGYPQLSVADMINYTSQYGKIEANVTSNKITFNGGWFGKVELL